MRTTNFTSTEDVKDAIENCFKAFEDAVNNLLAKTDFRIANTSISTCAATITLAIYTSPNSKEYARWNTLDLILEEDPFELKDAQFKTNIGTTGEFSLNDTDRGSRANFYIQVGKILGDSELLRFIKSDMAICIAEIRELREQWRRLNKKENN